MLYIKRGLFLRFITENIRSANVSAGPLYERYISKLFSDYIVRPSSLVVVSSAKVSADIYGTTTF